MKKTAAQRAAERRMILYKRFAAIYVANGRNATRAYMETHPGVAPNSAATHGGEWVRIGEVSEEIRRLTDEAWDKEAMTAKEVLGRMARIGRTNMADFFWRTGELDHNGNATQVGARKPLDELTEEQTERIKSIKYDFQGHTIYEMWDKPSQLTNVAKHLKLLTDRVDLRVGLKLEDLVGGVDEDGKDQA